MINSPTEGDDAAVERIVASGPRGAIALAGLTTLIVVALWFAFYLLVFVPRGGAPGGGP
jgi:hypothetical protein